MGYVDAELFPRERAELAPGAAHVPDWLPAERQRELLATCRDWARPPAGLRTVRTPGGGTMTARQVCLGLHWGVVRACPACGRPLRDNPGCPGPHQYPYAYTPTAVDGDGAPVKPFPGWLGEVARRAVADALGPAAVPGPPYDIALINFYDGTAHMGMHRDSEERADAPVVSLSLGDTCVSASATPRRGPGRTPTSSCAVAICSSSAVPPVPPTTGCPGSTRARHRPGWGWPGG